MSSLASVERVMVESIDACFAIPQRQGRILPAVVAPIPFLIPGGLVVAAAASAFAGQWPMVAAWATGTAFSGLMAFRHHAQCMSDAGAWSTGMADRYRASARTAREERMGFRFAAIALGLAVEAALAWVFVTDAAWTTAVSAFGFLVAESGLIGTLYAECAFPHAPDAGYPATF